MLMWLLAYLNLQLVQPAWRLLGSVWALPACLHPAEGTHQTEHNAHEYYQPVVVMVAVAACALYKSRPKRMDM